MDRKHLKASRVIVLFLACFSLAYSATAQDSNVITSENFRQLHSVSQINFVDWKAQVGTIENGWFTLNRDGSRIALMTRTGEVVIGDDSGNVVDQYSIPGGDDLPTSVQDVAFRVGYPVVVSVHTEGGAYYIAYRNYEVHQTEYFRFDTADVPLRIWDNGSTWLEVSPADYTRSRYVQVFNPSEYEGSRINEVLPPDLVHQFPSGPENDPDAFLRIGRIDPPMAITVSQDLIVKRWNLENGKVDATAPLSELPGAGQLSYDGRYFTWRDGPSKALHLLDFTSGIDRMITVLEGKYIPFLLLNSSASVIIGVNVDLKSFVVAWDVQTGELAALGDYRSCSRQPDMVRLSDDSTTLVVGCDTGLDIWRVS
ncbi:MAG: hypothetical protein GC179_15110 [Anaerolineaceae bacterium]|nr:hypothetical protein [Anaerolineaceae bacterium]